MFERFQRIQGHPSDTTLPAVHRTVTRCLVCGSNEVRTDEVVDRGIVLLAECRHCDHRWTSSAAADTPSAREVSRVRPALRVVREVASAA